MTQCSETVIYLYSYWQFRRWNVKNVNIIEELLKEEKEAKPNE